MATVPTRYVRSLALATQELKKQLNDSGFTIDDGDELVRFDRRKYFRSLSKKTLSDVAKAHHIKGRSKMGGRAVGYGDKQSLRSE